MSSAPSLPTTPQGSPTCAALRAQSLCRAPRRVRTVVGGMEAAASPEIPPRHPLASPTSQSHASPASPRASWTLDCNTPKRRQSGLRTSGGGGLFRADAATAVSDDDWMGSTTGSSGFESSDHDGHVSPLFQQLHRPAGSSPPRRPRSSDPSALDGPLMMATDAKRRRLAREGGREAFPRDLLSQLEPPLPTDACTSAPSSSDAALSAAPTDDFLLSIPATPDTAAVLSGRDDDMTLPPIFCTPTTANVLNLSF